MRQAASGLGEHLGELGLVLDHVELAAATPVSVDRSRRGRRGRRGPDVA
ncbi:MAG: hypothetical protein V9E94_14115 [Microthrixaceae bacterium]